ncbi:outer membrane beta-barrel protein [Myroides ceti]|uniref:Outer membrane beta-barrel protein n=1 Tax=Paenimyroides ceti TaxID=395087 RepID=A0ABT8CYQ9_9FLAO|nr:outer membrane beta-barrel protein [Paenimyroides ceti]MDN3708292.1 outer membrane beta-barrel protein [Paenimyroides ceti]
MKKILLLLSLFISLCSVAQNVQLKGKLTDSNKKPVESVTVYLSKAKDSTLLQYTTTDIQGLFSMTIKPTTEKSFMTFSLLGYEDKTLKFDTISESKDLGTLIMGESSSEELAELVVVTDAPIRVKQDTLEFNAASFKVRPDANVEALLKELPGVEIDSDKKITVNGQEVNQILVNGKPFFDTNGTIALQNLPAEIIKKIQVSDLKTKSEEFAKRKAASEYASINLTIDEKNNQGLLGKITGGYGTDDRYESSGLLNYFKGNRKISVLASSNNINSTGFSMDEIFDNMGGGRSQFFSFGGRSGGGFGFGNNTGITRTNMIGVNYSDQFFKDLEVNGSYYLNDTRNENNNRSRQVNLLPDGNFITESESSRINDNTNHNANFSFEYKLNPKTKIFVRPTIQQSSNRYDTKASAVSMDEDGTLFNESSEKSHTDVDNFTFKNAIEFNRILGENGKNLSFVLDNENTKTEGIGTTQSETVFYQGTNTDDIRNQQNITRSTSDEYNATLKYTQPILKDLLFDFGYTFNYENQTDVLSTYNFDAGTGGYSDFNGLLSNQTYSEILTSTPFAGINLNNEKIYLNFDSGLNIANFNAHALYLGNDYNVKEKFVSPYIRSSFRYTLEKGKIFSVRYNYNVSNPSAIQILPYERFNDPLNTYIGNSELDQQKAHFISLGFRNYNFQQRTGWSVNLSGNYYDSQIVSSTVFDENRKRTTTYENVADAYSISLFGNWNKSYKINEHTIRYGIGMFGSYGLSKGYTNAELYEAKTFTLTPRFYVNWDYGDLLSIAPSYNMSYNNNNYSNYQIDKTDYVVHTLNLQTTTYWPEKVTWGNDFGYTYNSNIADGFKKDFFLWNTSLAYSFLKDALTAKVKVYDILNQNVGTSRMISPISITDQENTVLKRYVMFSITYKFDKFGTGKDDSRNRGRRYMGPPGGMRNRM